MALSKENIAIIGCGAMGEALVRGLLSNGLVKPDQLRVSHPRSERRVFLDQHYGIRSYGDNSEAVARADVVVLAIKPQYFDEVVSALPETLNPHALVMSILAGIRIDRISSALTTSKVIRAMPNLPAKIGEGISVWTAATEVDEAEKLKAGTLLSAFGAEVYVSHEGDLDMATALSGTGPAYAFLFMEAMVDAGVHLGFSRHLAFQLVCETLRGSIQYAASTPEHLAKLRNYVTSPGGTTAEACYELEKGGLRTVLSDAVWAAYRRSKELGEP